MLRILLGLTLIFTLSCTEEISEELKNSSTSDALTDAQKFNGKSIKLEHLMDEELSYRIHKEGSSSLECELTSPSTGFFAKDYYQDLDDYAGADPQVANCILEAQELDLWKNGAKLKLTVDEYLCEYVTYEPFKFYDYPAGRTTRVVYEVECDDEACGTGCGNTYENIDLSGGAAAVSFSGAIDPSELSCYYDHSENGGPNCDNGSIKTVTYNDTTESVDHDDDPSTPNICQITGTTQYVQTDVSEIDCDGEITACLAGPSVDFFQDPTITTEIYNNEELEEFTQEFTIQAPAERIGESVYDDTNMYIANFSRICSNMTDLPSKNTAADFNGLDFQGKETERIWRSNNYSGSTATNVFIEDEDKVYNLSRNIGHLTNLDSSQSSVEGLYTDGSGAEYGSIGYTENPWRGPYRTSAYYSFKCLDKAFDTKAQIRLYIREWDRAYSDTVNPASFAYVSDIHLDEIMDSDDLTNDNEEYNNRTDWDDFFLNPNSIGTDMWLNNRCMETDTGVMFTRSIFPGTL
tara:strand:- start:108459 stop:110018 length:1560 start_codon:yes stop_codon:yes gene_type:complete